MTEEDRPGAAADDRPTPRQRRERALRAARAAAPSEWQSTKSGFTRESILRAVIALLADGGYPQLTMVEIARKAGLTKGAVQHYFPSKGAVVEATLDLIVADQLQIEAQMERHTGEAVDERLHSRRIDAVWHYLNSASYAAFLEIAFAARSDERLRTLVTDYNRRYHDTARRQAPDLLPEWTSLSEMFTFAAYFSHIVLEGMAARRHLGISDADEDRDVLAFVKHLVAEIFRGRIKTIA